MDPCRIWILVLALVFGQGRSQEPFTSLETCMARVKELEALTSKSEGKSLRQVQVAPVQEEAETIQEEELLKPGSPEFYKNCGFAFVCVVAAALAAGLTMGLVSIDPMEMEIIVRAEAKDLADVHERNKLLEDQSAAKRILPLLHDHHRLLVTLLLMNSIANEALPLFLDKVVPSWLAVIMSVSLVLMFGEIIPSAIFTGTEQLSMAAKFAGLVNCFQMVLAPVALPIARTLDAVLGADHKGRYNFAELRAIVGLHANLTSGTEPFAVIKSVDERLGIIHTEQPHHFTSETAVIFADAPGATAISTKLSVEDVYYVSPCQPLSGRNKGCTCKLYSKPDRRPTDLITFGPGELTSGSLRMQERDEIKIMHGVMSLTHMTTAEGLTALSKVYMLRGDQCLNLETLQQIDKMGHSRVPVFVGNKHNVRGYILVKKLIVITPEHQLSVDSMDLMPMTLVEPDTLMLDLLNKFQEDKCHMALVTSEPSKVAEAWQAGKEIPPDVHQIGIITLEDVMEKLIQENIEDESDVVPRASSRPRMTVSDAAMPVPSPNRLPRSLLVKGEQNLKEPLLQKEKPPAA